MPHDIQLTDDVQITFEGCYFDGANKDGSQVFEYSEESPEKIKSIKLIDWYCVGPNRPDLHASLKGESLDEMAEFVKWATDAEHCVAMEYGETFDDPWTQSAWEAWQARSRIGKK